MKSSLSLGIYAAVAGCQNTASLCEARFCNCNILEAGHFCLNILSHFDDAPESLHSFIPVEFLSVAYHGNGQLLMFIVGSITPTRRIS